MDTKKRIFKKMLDQVFISEATPMNEWSALLKPIVEYALKIMPSRLFRYRSFNEMQLDAFNNDIIYVVNPQVFNDPYDCLIRYDKDYLYNTIHQATSLDAVKQLRADFNNGASSPECWESLYGKDLSEIVRSTICNASDAYLAERKDIYEENKNEFFDNIDRALKHAENFLRKNMFIACFSETVRSIIMWSHYADSHKGFVLEYNARDLICRNDIDSCEDGVISNLFPVIYDSKRYDGTSFVESFLGRACGLNAYINDMMFYTKASLHKSLDWKYEREWRLAINKNHSLGTSCLDIKIKPVAIYYGNDMPSVNREKLGEIAKAKGINEYQMYIDTQSGAYSMKFIKI